MKVEQEIVNKDKFPHFTNNESNQFIIQTLCNLIKDTNAGSIERDNLIKHIISLDLGRKFVGETSYYNRYLVKKLIYFILLKK
jgi:hypothetical protein